MYTIMIKFTTLVLVHLWYSNTLTVALVQYRTAIRVSDYDNLYFNTNHIADLIDVASPTRCATFCQQKQDCLTFFYNLNTKTCRLHSGTFFYKNEGIFASIWRFYAFANKDCPTYYGFNLQSSGLCLHVATSLYNFNDGQQYCSSLNSRLVTLETTDKRLAVEDFIAKQGIDHNVMLGLQKTPSGWQWESGNFLGQEENWGIGQPFCPSHAVCNCARILLLWLGLTWNDDTCLGSSTIICEYLP